MPTPAKPVGRKPVARKAPIAKSAAKSAPVAAARPAEAPKPAAPVAIAAPAVAPAPARTPAPAVAPVTVQAPVTTPESIDQPAPARAVPSAVSANSPKGPKMTDAMETAKTYAEEAKTRIQGAMADVNEKTKAAMEKSAKAFEELGDIAKGNLEAVVESSKIAAKGFEALSQDAAEFGRKSFEKTSATMKSFAAVKTPAEFFQLQSELLSQTFDAFAAEASKNSETVLKLVGDISQPISSRVSVVTEKMKSLAA